MGKTKILIIHDEPVFNCMAEMLRGDYVVHTTSDTEDGVEQAKAESPEIILVVPRRSIINGYVVCQRLKSHERTKDIVVIVIADAMDTTDYSSGGADLCLQKPISMRQLLKELKEILETG